MGSYAGDTAVVPVAMSVVAPFQSGMQLANADSYAYDMDRPYNNGAVRACSTGRGDLSRAIGASSSSMSTTRASSHRRWRLRMS
ncbi:MAG: hypothetical protein R2873_16730 [Caldilineaceae bacterium]